LDSNDLEETVTMASTGVDRRDGCKESDTIDPLSATSSARWEWPMVGLLALLPTIVKLVAYPHYPGSDDSFIHLAVAQNIVTGGGWGVIPGDPVNLSSSPIYTMLLLALQPLNPLVAAQVISALFTTAALVLIYSIARKLTLSRPLAFTGLAVAAANVHLWRWTGTVMETTLAFMLVTLVIYVLYRITPVDRKSWVAPLGLGLLIGVATLTRFELGLLLPLAIVDLWLRGERRPEVARRAALLAPGFLIGVAPWLVFSYLYFGTPVPTTYSAKTSGLILANLSVTQDVAAVLLSGYGLAILVALIAAGTLRSRLPGIIERHLLVFIWPVLLFAFYYLKTTSLQSSARYYLPGMAAISIAVVILLAAIPAHRIGKSALLAVSIMSVTLGVVINSIFIAPTLRGFNENYRSTMIEAAQFLRLNCDGSGPALVVRDIGILAAEGISKCPLADAGALASPELRGMTLEEMISATNPQFVVESIGESSGAFLAERPQLRLVHSRSYLAHGVSTAGAKYWLNIYAVVPG